MMKRLRFRIQFTMRCFPSKLSSDHRNAAYLAFSIEIDPFLDVIYSWKDKITLPFQHLRPLDFSTRFLFGHWSQTLLSYYHEPGVAQAIFKCIFCGMIIHVTKRMNDFSAR